MNTTGDSVLNKNTLRVKYQENIPFFYIFVNSELFLKFQTAHRLEMMASLLPDSSLKLTIRLKSFRSTVNFNTVLPSWDKHDQSIQHFLSSFILLDKVNVKITPDHREDRYERMISLPLSVRETCKFYIGELLSFQKDDGLEETFKSLPVGFLVPYTKPSYFLFLCKVEDSFFDKIKFIHYDKIDFHVSTNPLFIIFSMSYQGLVFASLPIKKEDVCEDILEDFQVLLQHKKIDTAITNHSMNQQQYLKFSKELQQEQVDLIYHFFFGHSVTSRQPSS